MSSSSPQRSGRIPNNPTREHIKAHIDCSNGINDSTLLAACLGAWEGKHPNDAFQELFSTILGDATDERFVPPVAMARKWEQSKYISIRTSIAPFNPPVLEFSDIDAFYRSILDSTKRVKSIMWEAFPEWVVETTVAVFNEALKAFPQQRAVGEEQIETGEPLACTKDAHSHIFNVIATLMCLYSMGIREVTCSPLPIICSTSESSSISDILESLLQGLPIDPAKTVSINHKYPSSSLMSTAFGIALIRVLTGANTPRRSRTTPMILRKQGFGIDHNDKNLKVSIAVGVSEESCFDGNDSEPTNSNAVGHYNVRIKENSLFHSDRVAHMETNLDDISGESLAFAIELLLNNGAIDAWVTPIVMKKGRPAHTLHCLCKDNDSGGSEDENKTLDLLLELIFEHTSTLGVRIYRCIPRAKLDRSMVTVTTPFVNTFREGRVDVKVSSFKNGRVVRKKAEFDHCKQIAIESGVTIQEVAGEAMKEYEKMSTDNSNT